MNQEELELLMLKHASNITSQRLLAGEIGFSVGKINYVLNALIAKGLIKYKELQRELESDMMKWGNK